VQFAYAIKPQRAMDERECQEKKKEVEQFQAAQIAAEQRSQVA
jgi:hypothetical protein